MKTVLLVDDDPNLRLLVRTTLEEVGCRLLEAGNGAAALIVAQRDLPDLILLDWMMPEMSGIEFLASLRRNSKTAHVPVLMLTAKGRDRDREEALAAGCDRFLVKPFSPIELLGIVGEILQDWSAVGAGSRNEAPVGGEASLVQLGAVDPQLALYVRDLRRALETGLARQKELTEANARLVVLSRLKSDFLQYMSHELKTPLYALSAVELLDAARDEADQKELIQLLRDGYERLRSFVEKGLQYFEWVGREQRDCQRAADFSQVLRSAIDDVCARRADGRRIRTSGLEATVPVRVHASGMRTVLKIVLENALRFSPPEKNVDVSLATNERCAVLRVADQGIGLSPKLLVDVFHPFGRADVRRQDHGTGLNLALAHVIVETHGGSIRAESAGENKGATFVVELPLCESTELRARALDDVRIQMPAGATKE